MLHRACRQHLSEEQRAQPAGSLIDHPRKSDLHIGRIESLHASELLHVLGGLLDHGIDDVVDRDDAEHMAPLIHDISSSARSSPGSSNTSAARSKGSAESIADAVSIGSAFRRSTISAGCSCASPAASAPMYSAAASSRVSFMAHLILDRLPSGRGEPIASDQTTRAGDSDKGLWLSLGIRSFS